MKDAEMNYIWEIDKSGAHNSKYWKLKMPKALEFIEKH